jgi:putative sigma-54 modulation protein
MKIIIQTHGFTATKTILNLITRKLRKLDQVSPRILEGRVLLRLEKSDTRNNKLCEIKLAIPGNDLFASKQSETFEEASTKVIEALKRQLSDQKVEHNPRGILH